jgi:hypothetical protein
MESLLYQFSYQGLIGIVNQGKKIGEMEVVITPLISQAGNLVKIDENID